MKGWKVLTGVIVLVAAGVLFLMTYYPKLAQNVLIPEVEQVETVRIRLKGDSLFAELGIRLRNSGPFKMNIDSIDYEVHFDTLRILQKAQDLAIVLKSGQVDTFMVTVAIPLKKLTGRIAELQHRDSADIKSDVRVVYKTFWGRSNLNHKKTSRIGMPVPPEMNIEGVKFAGMDKKNVQLLVSLAFVNKGKLTLQISDITYKVNVSDLATTEGKIDKLINILPGETTREDVPVSIELLKPLKGLFLIATNRDKVTYKARVDAIVSAGEALHNTEISVSKQGRIELRK